MRPHGLQPLRAPLSMGFPRQEYWSGLPLPSPGESSQTRGLNLQEDSLPSEPPGKPRVRRVFTANSKEPARTVSPRDAGWCLGRGVKDDAKAFKTKGRSEAGSFCPLASRIT